MEPYDPELLYLVIASFIVAFILSFGIGANDVANSFGTSVGAKVITIKTACIVATIFEIAGAVLIGYKVSDTMRKAISENLYLGTEKELMLGYLAALGGSGIWLLLATFFNLPISGTHSIVGATIGFSLIARGFSGLRWMTLVRIICSWFISPMLSGIISVILFLMIGRFIINSATPVKSGLRMLPIFYGITVAVNVFSVVHGGSKLLHSDDVSIWMALLFSAIVGIITVAIVYLFVVPRKHVQIVMSASSEQKMNELYHYENSSEYATTDVCFDDRSTMYENGHDDMLSSMVSSKPHFQLDQSFEDICLHDHLDDTERAENLKLKKKMSTKKCFTRGITPSSSTLPLIKDNILAGPHDIREARSSRNSDEIMTTSASVESIFSFLQILTAIFGSFAHGGNDVSNAIGPLVAIWLIYSEGSAATKGETPFFILLFGGIGISIGLCVWGRRVIKTIGEDLTKITPSTGFSIEIGASMTVLLASKIGVPISTTHCKVGSVVFVGCVNSSREGVDWKLFRHIVYAWVITVPVAAFLSAVIMLVLTKFML